MLQVGRDLWLSMLPEIVRAAADGVPDRRYLACYQRRILHAADSYRHIESLSHQIGVAVEKLHLDRESGIARRQLSQDRGHAGDAERDRSRHAQLADGIASSLRSEVLGLLQIGQQLNSAVVDIGARLGKADLPCRAVQKAGGEPVFQVADAPPDSRLRQGKPFP